MITYDATDDDKVGIIATLGFQWLNDNPGLDHGTDAKFR